MENIFCISFFKSMLNLYLYFSKVNLESASAEIREQFQPDVAFMEKRYN